MQRLIDATADPERARALQVALNKVERLVPQVLAAVRVQAMNPKDKFAKEHLTAVLAQWDAAVAELKVAATAAQEPDVIVGATRTFPSAFQNRQQTPVGAYALS